MRTRSMRFRGKYKKYFVDIALLICFMIYNHIWSLCKETRCGKTGAVFAKWRIIAIFCVYFGNSNRRKEISMQK